MPRRQQPNPYASRAWKRIVAEVKRTESICHLCGGWIDPTLDGTRHPHALTVDHLEPLSQGGELLDRAGCRAAHRTCNSRRNGRPLTAQVYAECRAAMNQATGTTASRRW